MTKRIQPHGLFRVWSADQVAECLEGITDDLYRALWAVVPKQGKRTECNDNYDDVALANYWSDFSQEDAAKLNSLATAHEENQERMYQEWCKRNPSRF